MEANKAASCGIETAESIIKPPAAGKTKKLVKVEQEIIDALLARPKRMDVESFACPLEGTIVDVLAELLDDPEELEMWRAEYAAAVATFKKLHDMDADILKQYSQKGYAMVEVDGDN